MMGLSYYASNKLTTNYNSFKLKKIFLHYFVIHQRISYPVDCQVFAFFKIIQMKSCISQEISIQICIKKGNFYSKISLQIPTYPGKELPKYCKNGNFCVTLIFTHFWASAKLKTRKCLFCVYVYVGWLKNANLKTSKNVTNRWSVKNYMHENNHFYSTPNIQWHNAFLPGNFCWPGKGKSGKQWKMEKKGRKTVKGKVKNLKQKGTKVW